jgi:hypothetical protein
VFVRARLIGERAGMAPGWELGARCNRQTLAAREIYRERMALRVISFKAATAAFKDALLAFVDEPSPQNAGRYLAASERLTSVARERGTSDTPVGTARAVPLATAS